jgi:hypothetical protein
LPTSVRDHLSAVHIGVPVRSCSPRGAGRRAGRLHALLRIRPARSAEEVVAPGSGQGCRRRCRNFPKWAAGRTTTSEVSRTRLDAPRASRRRAAARGLSRSRTPASSGRHLATSPRPSPIWLSSMPWAGSSTWIPTAGVRARAAVSLRRSADKSRRAHGARPTDRAGAEASRRYFGPPGRDRAGAEAPRRYVDPLGMKHPGATLI